MVPNSAYVVKFKSTFRTDLQTRKENANIAFKKIVTTLDLRFKDLKCMPRAERGEVWASVTNLFKKQEGCCKETCATKEKVSPIGCFTRVRF